MGMSFSCPGADYTALDESFEALFMRSISFEGDDVNAAVRSVSFNGRDSEPSILKALGSGKMIIEGSLSFNGRDLDPFQMETKFSIKTAVSDKEKTAGTASSKCSRFENSKENIPKSPVLESGSPKHVAAVKLQKVYKSFRTRRQLADCAVLVEQRWWKLLDFALLKRSSVSFFDIEKPESVVSRWSRARTRAAKVGKGLSKDEKAQKLALQHWLEAIDPRHRYGHNLNFYYVCWLRCESRQPFFYWLDVGEGKEVNLEQHCPRWKLQQQCIKYLGPKEREVYEVVVEDGKFLYKQNRQLLDTSEGPKDSKWIFVLSTSKTLYVGKKKKGTFQHSSFLAGGATSAAGRLVVENGILKAVWPHSGHYRPTEENFQELVSFLKESNVDLTDVKKNPTEEDEESWNRIGSISGLRSRPSELDLTREIATFPERSGSKSENELQQPCASDAEKSNFDVSKTTDSSVNPNSSVESVKESSALERLYASCVRKLFKEFEGESEEETDGKTSLIAESERADSSEASGEPSCSSSSSAATSQLEAHETDSEQHYEYQKRNLFEEDRDSNKEPAVLQELILHRINSRKGMKSYQLGKQLSFKWTTGAGPRIGCVRDYPSELQFHALEQMNLSPRSDGAGIAKSNASPRIATTLSPMSSSSLTSPLKENSYSSHCQDLPKLR